MVATSGFSPLLLLNRPDTSLPDMNYLKLRVLNSAVVPVTSDLAGSIELNCPDSGFIVLPLRQGLCGSVKQNELANLSRGDLLVFSGKCAGYLLATKDMITANQSEECSSLAATEPKCFSVNSAGFSCNAITIDQLICGTATTGVMVDEPVDKLLAIILKIELCEIMKGGIGDSLPDSLLLTPVDSKRSYIASLGEQLAGITDTASDISRARLARFTELLLIEVLDLYLNLDSTTSRLLRGSKDLRIGEAIKAVHEKPEHNWTVSGLAAIANMSRSLFANRFKATYGETPLNYVKQCRIHRAKILLTESIAPLDQIADQCGYTSQSAFIKAFSTAIGDSPGRWRTMQKSQSKASLT